MTDLEDRDASARDKVGNPTTYLKKKAIERDFVEKSSMSHSVETLGDVKDNDLGFTVVLLS